MGWKPKDLLEFVRNRAPADYPKIKYTYPLIGATGTIVGKLWSVVIHQHLADIAVLEEGTGGKKTYVCGVNDECVEILESYVTIPAKPRDGTCPKCGDAGEWRSLALVCRNGHGVFAG